MCDIIRHDIIIMNLKYSISFKVRLFILVRTDLVTVLSLIIVIFYEIQRVGGVITPKRTTQIGLNVL